MRILILSFIILLFFAGCFQSPNWEFFHEHSYEASHVDFGEPYSENIQNISFGNTIVFSRLLMEQFDTLERLINRIINRNENLTMRIFIYSKEKLNNDIIISCELKFGDHVINFNQELKNIRLDVFENIWRPYIVHEFTIIKAYNSRDLKRIIAENDLSFVSVKLRINFIVDNEIVEWENTSRLRVTRF